MNYSSKTIYTLSPDIITFEGYTREGSMYKNLNKITFKEVLTYFTYYIEGVIKRRKKK